MLGGYVYGMLHAQTVLSRCYAAVVLMLCLVIVVVAPLVLAGLVCSPWGEWAFPGVFLVLTGVLMVLSTMALGWAVVHGAGRRAYMPATRDAILIVGSAERGWKVENFFAARPGWSNTAPLWKSTVPALVEMADAQGVKMITTAMNETLKCYYMRKIPGLRRVGVLHTGQVRLLRVPRQASP